MPIDDIKPYWRNPRNNDSAVSSVVKSIEEFGFNGALVLDSENVVIVGHTRLKALKMLGWTEVPVIISSMSEDKARKYRIIDNKTSEVATWDNELLIPELRSLDMSVFEDDFPELIIKPEEVMIDESSLSQDFPSSFQGVESEGYQPSQSQDSYDRMIESENSKLENKFNKMENEMADRNSKIAQNNPTQHICPECGHEFSVI